MSLGLLEYFYLLSSVHNSYIVSFFIFCLSSTLKKVLGHFRPPASGLKFSLSYKFSFLFYFSLKIGISSWVVEFLENTLPFSLKQDLVYSHQSLAEERLLNPWPRLEWSYKMGSAWPSFRLPVSFPGIGSLVSSET